MSKALETPVEVPISFSVAAVSTAPSGSILFITSIFLVINCCIFVASDLLKLAAGFVIFLTGIPISSAIISGIKLPNFLKVKFLVGILGKTLLIASTALFKFSLLNNLLALVGLLLGLSSLAKITSSAVSSAIIPLASSISSTNCSPKFLLAIFIYFLKDLGPIPNEELIYPVSGATGFPAAFCLFT